MSSRIEQIIEEIEEYIEGCKYQPLSGNTRIIVNKDEIEELLTELRMKTPDEIKRYQKIISNKEAILADAQAKADNILAQAQVQTSELVSEHQIMQQAYAQANEVVMIASKQAQEILDNATMEANDIRAGAIQYTDEILKNLQELIASSIETTQARHENLVNNLTGYLNTIAANRMELAPQPEQPQENPQTAAAPEPQPEDQTNNG